MADNTLPTYKTSHIPLAAYLRLKGSQLMHVTAENRRGVFEFKDVPREHIIEFNNGHATVEPNEFAERMSQLTQTAKRILSEPGV